MPKRLRSVFMGLLLMAIMCAVSTRYRIGSTIQHLVCIWDGGRLVMMSAPDHDPGLMRGGAGVIPMTAIERARQ